MLGFAEKGMGANSECGDYAAHHAFFLKFASGLVFLNICFVMTSCTKSLSEQTKSTTCLLAASLLFAHAIEFCETNI